MELSRFKEDKSALEDGRWFEFGTSRIKMRSLSSEKSRTYRRDLEKREFSKYRMVKEEIPDKVLEDTLYRQIVDVIIIDWEGMKLDGQDFPYSKENARLLLEEFPPVRERIAAIVTDDLSFTENYGKDVVKN